MAIETLDFVQIKSKAASVKKKDVPTPSLRTPADVTPMPRRVVQGPALPSTNPARNQEYVPAGDVIRKQLEYIEAAFNAVASAPDGQTRRFTRTSMLISVECCMRDLAACLDLEDIKIRYPVFPDSEKRK